MKKSGLFFIAALLCCNLQSTFAQESQSPPLPIDKDVRIGKLDNGLTYYIRHNATPEKRVEFHLAQKVGSILEEPQQRGLAHFLEHMAFNGSKNFPGDEKGLNIIAWCETKGIQFASNLNAYTSVDKTVYRISDVPTTNANVVDSCLLILHDWSNALLLTDKEIDKERGVIREEWRSTNSGMLRILSNGLPTIYPNSKYADCIPIGNMEVINNFPYKELRSYYSKWYRPDLQGIIIVGDVNVDEMEQKLKKAFADIKKPSTPATRTYYPVENNKEPIVFVGTDKELPSPMVIISFKHEATPDALKNNMDYYATQYMINIVINMLNTRFEELVQKPNQPFNGANSEFGDFLVAKTKRAFILNASCKAEYMSSSIKALLAEAERARRFGFTAGEYERAKANFLKSLESEYNERNKTQNIVYANSYINHFLDNEPIVGIEFDYATMNQIVPSIPLELINKVTQQLISDENQTVLIAGTENGNATYPSKDEVTTLLKNMKSLDIKPYEDKVSNEPLITQKPKKGKILSEKKGDVFGTTKLTLSNGATVYIKKTDFKNDEIAMAAISVGGNSLLPDNEILNINQLNSVALIGGVSKFSKIELSKMLAGKSVSVEPTVEVINESMMGNCSPNDLETMLQLTYLSFTSPRKDAEAFESFKNRLKAELQNAEANPMKTFSDSASTALYGKGNPRFMLMKPEMVDQINYDRILEMYKERFKNAGDFNFYFVGNIDIEKAKPLIEEYIASLPSSKVKETFKNKALHYRKGQYVKEFAKQQEIPQATILFVLSGNSPYNLKNKIMLDLLQQALNVTFTEEIREKEGGTYGVNTSGDFTKFPEEKCDLQIFFQTDPAKKDKLTAIVSEQLKKVANEGPNVESLQKAKEHLLKKNQENQIKNYYWINNLYEYFNTGVDYTKNFEGLVKNITVKDIQMFMQDLLKQGNEIKVIMTTPKAEKDK